MRRLLTYLIPVILYFLLALGIRKADLFSNPILKTLGLNDTLLILVPLLLVLLALLDQLLFQPILQIITRREKVLADSRDLRDQYGRLAEEKIRVYEEKLLAAKQEAAAFRNEGRARSQAELRTQVQQARDASLEQTEKARTALGAEMEKARESLRSRAEELGRELAGSFLGRKVS